EHQRPIVVGSACHIRGAVVQIETLRLKTGNLTRQNAPRKPFAFLESFIHRGHGKAPSARKHRRNRRSGGTYDVDRHDRMITKVVFVIRGKAIDNDAHRSPTLSTAASSTLGRSLGFAKASECKPRL